ncbi:MAG: glycosyltransferase [Thalassospira sp.]|nr:glycosyltransferase [Thalassospira sp.]
MTPRLPRAFLTTFSALGYLAVILLLLWVSLGAAIPQEQQRALIALGLIGVWRYGWWGLNGVRALLYRFAVYPRIKVQTAAVSRQRPPIAVVVTAYRIPGALLLHVLRALFFASIRYGGTVTIALSVSTASEAARAVRIAARHIHNPQQTRLLVEVQDGSGKRAALANSLKAIRTQSPRPRVVALMDGDGIVPPDIFERCIPHFLASPALGALTVNNRARGVSCPPFWESWINLKHRLRHFWMCSHALSGRLLVLTGRFSCFHGDIALSPRFINRLRHDALQHWRFGTVRLVTGDDKSTWLGVLRRRAVMRYLPDVLLTSIEMERSGFFRGSAAKMRRWSGNMLRAGHMALTERGLHVPLFIRAALVDQRLSIATGLLAPTLCLLALLHGYWHWAGVYLAWLLLSRLIWALALGGIQFRPSWPLLLLYNQVAGNLIKAHTLAHLDEQEWWQNKHTKRQSRHRRHNNLLLFLAALTFLYSVAAITGF